MDNKDFKTNNEVAAYWNKRGGTYEAAWASYAKKRLNGLETGLIEQELNAMEQKHPDTAVRSLDVGMGTGRIGEKILKHNVTYYGLDISDEMVHFCKEKFKNNEKVSLLTAYDVLQELPTDWGKFDFVTAIRVLSYGNQWKQSLHNIYNAMAPGGTCIFTLPNRHSSIFISKMLQKRDLNGHEVTYSEVMEGVKKIGFSEVYIVGFSRILDTIYDMCNNRASSSILFFIEKLFRFIFGRTFLARLFYIVCKK